MNSSDYKSAIAEIRSASNARIEAAVRELQASGKMVKGCKNAKMPKTIVPKMDRAPVVWSKRAPRENLLRRPLPCIHLGPVSERCMYDDPLRDVHFCTYEGHEIDRCVRGRNSRGHSCDTCEHYDSGKKKVEMSEPGQSDSTSST